MLRGLPGMPRAGASGGMLNELMGSCRVWEVFDSPQCPLCFPYLHLPLRTNSFSELPRAPCRLTLDLLACLGCCPSRTISVHQTLPGEAAARVPGSCIFSHLASFLGSLLPQQMAFLCFRKVHMAYKREYLFNCKT